MKGTTTLGFYCTSLSWGGLEMNTVRYAKWMQDGGYRVILFAVAHSPMADEAKKIGLQFVPVARCQTKNLHVVAVSQGNVQEIRDKHHRIATLIRFELLFVQWEDGKRHSSSHQCRVNISIQ
jgi:hypothetical protein